MGVGARDSLKEATANTPESRVVSVLITIALTIIDRQQHRPIIASAARGVHAFCWQHGRSNAFSTMRAAGNKHHS